MRIKQLKLNNIGSFVGEHCFSFQTDNAQKQIVVIGGRNGAGKTTLFESMRLCLYGYRLYGYRQNSQTYTNIVKRLISDQAKVISSATAGISMQLYIEDGYANSVYEINRQWSLNGKTLKENLFIYKDGKLLNSEEMQDFDNYLMQTIPPALFNFHFFDGEKISSFVFDQTSGHAFRKAFLQICGLDTFDLIEEQLQSITHSSKGDSQSDIQSEYEAAKKDLVDIEEKYTLATNKLKEIQSEIDSTQDQIVMLDEAMQQYGGIENDVWKSFEKKIQEEENRREELRHILKAAANDVIPFIVLKDQLESLEQQLMAEEKLKRNRLFREKLFDPSLQEKLQQELKPFLVTPKAEVSDNLLDALYRTLKEETSESELEFLHLSENDAMDLIAKIRRYQGYNLQSLIDAEQAIEDSLEYTKILRTEMESKEVIDSNQYLAQKNNLLMRLDTKRQQYLDEKDNLVKTEEMLKASQKMYLKAYENYKTMLKEKSVTDMSARALLAFGELKHNLYAKYVAQVEESFSRNFHRLISKTDLIDGIYISSTFEVTAYKQSEIEIENILKQIQEYGEDFVCANIGERAYQAIKDCGHTAGLITVPVKVEQHFSAGEKQIFVMALYQSLTEIRTAELPFVIDTPLARIDREHRKNILTYFFAQLPGQVIILSTDEEINNEGLQLLDDKISDVYLIEHQASGASSVSRGSYFKGVLA